MTEKQITERGGRILDEELKKGVPIVFTGRCKRLVGHSEVPAAQKALNYDGEGPSTGGQPPPEAKPANEPTPTPAHANETRPVYSTGFFVREYQVWNFEQTDGMKLPKKVQDWMIERDQLNLGWTPEAGLDQLRSSINKAGVAPLFFDRIFDCYYEIGRHEIHAPKDGYFNSELDKWESIAHETVHATGAKSLLNRPTLGKHRDTQEYALEEITAVMGSLFICQDCGVPVTPERERNWTSYLKGYGTLAILEKNPALFVRALVYADFAAQFILNPDKRPQFIKDREAPNQVEFSFPEYSPSRERAVTSEEVSVPEAPALPFDVDQAATALEAIGQERSPEAPTP